MPLVNFLVQNKRVIFVMFWLYEYTFFQCLYIFWQLILLKIKRFDIHSEISRLTGFQTLIPNPGRGLAVYFRCYAVNIYHHTKIQKKLWLSSFALRRNCSISWDGRVWTQDKGFGVPWKTPNWSIQYWLHWRLKFFVTVFRAKEPFSMFKKLYRGRAVFSKLGMKICWNPVKHKNTRASFTSFWLAYGWIINCGFSGIHFNSIFETGYTSKRDRILKKFTIWTMYVRI